MDENTLNDLLECSVCLERFEEAKVLPCQHTFCRKCLEVIVQSHQKLRCPECRVLVDLKIDDLPPNVILMRILGGMKSTASAAQSNHTPVTHSPRTPKNATSAAPPPASAATSNNQPNAGDKGTVADDNRKNLRAAVPHAKALFDFTSKESGDLSFKKGDLVVLRRKIDHNWFVGECGGREGAFPINHVEVLVPLPLAQCKALYDFHMGPNEEEGCLVFKRGAIIQVLRRVDHNWAEGRIGDCIGIFPLAFVEMNPFAKQLIDTASKMPASGVRLVPPTPPSSLFEPNSSDSSSSTVTTSPNSSATSSSSDSSTAPSSPIASLPIPSLVQKEKRHSLTAMFMNGQSSSGIAPSAHRHSAEILGNIYHSQSQPQPQQQQQQQHQLHQQQQKHQPHQHQQQQQHHQKSTSQPASLVMECETKQSARKTVGRPDVLKNTPPYPFVAIYPYKPQKVDELELRKGHVYFVTECCQDGWFKGISQNSKSGVFPGNYVTPLRYRDYKNQPHSMQQHTQQQQPPAQQPVQLQQSAQSQPHHPPELPPRNSAASTSCSSSTSVWAKPFGHSSADALPNARQKAGSSSAGVPLSTTSTNKESNKKESTSSAAVNLMKRLTNIKRSKSPTSNISTVATAAAATTTTTTVPPSYSMDNPSFEDTPLCAAAKPLGPIHVRSGSCPSQLLQSLPTNIGDLHLASKDSSIGPVHHSQRLKGHKERPSIIRGHAVPPIDGLAAANRVRGIADGGCAIMQYAGAIGPGPAPHHRKSQSLDAATISSQLAGSLAKGKTQPHVWARFRCIVAYPPNSEIELELHVGDIIYVHKKRDNGWYKGTHQRTGKTGLFPASFVEPDM